MAISRWFSKQGDIKFDTDFGDFEVFNNDLKLSRISIEILKNVAITGNIVISGYEIPLSHFDTAAVDTPIKVPNWS